MFRRLALVSVAGIFLGMALEARPLQPPAPTTMPVSRPPAPPSADYYAQNPAAPFHSTTLQEYAPVQTTGGSLPGLDGWSAREAPTAWAYLAHFSGKPGQPAGHEGTDFVHNRPSVPHVPVIAVAAGTVAYVRTGCPQSALFTPNKSLREAGAGWGNHVVIYHGNGIYTRYAHLAPGSIRARPGDRVDPADILGEMGNSGRSEVRHLHFEVGYRLVAFSAGKPAQSFDLVFDPRRFLPLCQAAPDEENLSGGGNP